MTSEVSVGVIGAGIVGLAVAHEILERLPGSRVTVLEKENGVAAHQTGHNSGVVHAGLYYKPGSLKASLCRRGGPLLKEFCQAHGIAYRELGKLVVALDDRELAALVAIEQRARDNQVPDLVRLDHSGLREIEPHVAGIAALHSPHTAVVDYVRVSEVVAEQITSAGGRVLLSSPVSSISEFGDRVTLGTPNGALTFDRVIACAGLSSDAVSKMAGPPDDLKIIPFRGEYFALDERTASLVNGLVYPVPDPRYPFLGVHLTRDVHGGVHVGPNAVPAMALEGYRRRDVNLGDLRGIATWPGSRRLAAKHWRSAISEGVGSASRHAFAARVRRYLPAVSAADMTPIPAGVRAQAVDRTGALVDDFALQRHGRVTILRNAPSPAATSSFAIAAYLVDEAFHPRGSP
ncbi:MAG TPA: L-2-hydroxyglutarate oxidase [Candidatus Saccharimonadales bacterium]|nr:L-2-hydroxyglutarate oxidase [Candidatus Saccharimonadales bacterium]